MVVIEKILLFYSGKMLILVYMKQNWNRLKNSDDWFIESQLYEREHLLMWWMTLMFTSRYIILYF